MFIMIAYSSPVDKNANNINDIKSNNYVKIGNITFMNNFVYNNGIIKSNNINKTSINNIYNYDNNDIKNNNITSYKYNYIKTYNTNYLLQYYNNSNIKYTIAFTEKFNDYNVEIGDMILNENNNTISYIYANIVPVNSSKILSGNEFTLNYKSNYNNEMKTLINNIELISFIYMNSNNNTINKFGIEYNYIAIAMNNMLKLTDNNIKNITINKTSAIAIDYNWWCLLWITGYIAAIIFLALATIGTMDMLIAALVALGYATLSVIHSCFHDFYL